MGTCQSRAADSFGVATLDGIEAHVDRGTAKTKVDMASMVSPSEKTTVTFPETPSYGSLLQKQNPTFVSPLSKQDSINGSGTSETQPSEQGDYNSSSFISQDSRSNNKSIKVPHASGKGSTVKAPEILDSQNRKSGFGTPRLLRLGKARTERDHAGQGQNTPTSLIPKRITMQDNKVQRPAPLIAPPKNSVAETTGMALAHGSKPKTSVTPQIIANFNRLKIQVQLAEQKAMNRRRKAKLEDRFEDVKAYRDLWKDYERLKKQVNDRGQSRHDELDNGKSDDKSIDLMQPTSWYFDFRSLKMHEHLDDDNDNHSQASMSLLSEGTLEAQREYYREKRRQQKNATAMRPKHRTGPSDQRSVASARSALSRASASYLRGQTDPQAGDYGPIRDDDACTVDMSYIGSDDSTPRTRTGRTVGDDMSRTTINDDAGSFVSELDMDNDYNVRRKRRPRRNVPDDSSLDTYDDKSVGGFTLSSVEFDMTEFLPRIRDSTQEAHNVGQVNSEIEPAKTAPPSSKTYAMPSYKCSPTSRIEHYGFDPAAPLSSQLALFAQPVPSLEIDDAKTGHVRWRKFEDKESSTARRLEDVFDSTHDDLQPVRQAGFNENKATSVKRSGDSSRQIEGTDHPEETHVLNGIPTDIQIVTKSADPVTKPSQVAEITPASYSHLYAMSPSNFLMMSSVHEPSSSQLFDDAQAIDTNMNQESVGIDGSMPDAPVESVMIGPSEASELASIVSMPTEHFLQMSTWYSTPLGLGFEETCTTNGSDHNGHCQDCKDETGVATVKLESQGVPCPIESPLPNTSETRQDRSEGDLGRIIVSMSMPQDEDFDDISNQVVQAVGNLLKKFRDSV